MGTAKADMLSEVKDLHSNSKDQPSSIIDDGIVSNILHPIDKRSLRKYTWKCDLHLLPLLSVLYLFNALDRSNLANARTANLLVDLHMSVAQYNLVLTFYTVPFFLMGPVGSIISRIITPRWSITLMLLGFGIASICTAAVTTFGGLMACRVIIGIFEGGFLPSVAVYLSSFYNRQQLASRFAIFYAAASLASAFGGLIAFGVFQLSSGNLHTWQYLFLIEGGLTILVAILAGIFLPASIDTANFLTKDDKKAGMASQLLNSVDGASTKFGFKRSLREFKTWHIYLRAIIYFSVGVVLGTSGNFLPIIVQRLGYDTVKTNLYTVAPAATAAVFTVAIAFSSDRFREKGLHMVFVQLLSIAGYIILITASLTNQKALTYFAVFLTTIGAYPNSVLFLTWTLNNITNMDARASTAGFLAACANSAGLVSSNIFIANQAPRYMGALKVNLICASIAMIVILGYSLWMRYENNRRDRIYGKAPEGTSGVGDSRDPNFRFSP